MIENNIRLIQDVEHRNNEKKKDYPERSKRGKGKNAVEYLIVQVLNCNLFARADNSALRSGMGNDSQS